MGQLCPDRSSESLKKGALLMSKQNSTECVLVGPGHNLPSTIELANLQQEPFTETITYLDHGVFRIGTCSCGRPDETWSEEEIYLAPGYKLKSGYDLRIQNEAETPSVSFLHKGIHTGCQELFAVHESSALMSIVEASTWASLVEILLDYPQTRVLMDTSTGQTFWLKGNDGSVVRQTPVFYVTRGSQHGCMDFSWYELPISGPVVSPCINNEGM
jgi:hypothetical protein